MFPVCQFQNRQLSEIKIYPIDQGFGRPRPQRGRPVLAEGEVATRVLERVSRLSKRYGTQVVRAGDVGIIRL
jgi:poly-gamma-glutamate synthesis protein (capsule biosynthesis protein)